MENLASISIEDRKQMTGKNEKRRWDFWIRNSDCGMQKNWKWKVNSKQSVCAGRSEQENKGINDPKVLQYTRNRDYRTKFRL